MPDFARAFRTQPVHLIILGLILALVLFGTYTSDRFATVPNFANVQDQMVALGLIALAQTIVILSGGIDLSYAGLLGLLSALVAGMSGGDPTQFFIAATAVLMLGAGIGALNGVCIAWLGIHPLIVTLGMSSITLGCALLYTQQPAGSVPLAFEDFVYGRLGTVPYSAIFMVLLYILVGFILWRTRFGINIVAIGDNEAAASLSGVPVKRTKVLVYALSGLLAAVTAIYLSGRFGVGDPKAGTGFDLRSITPVIVGGTLLSGGRGGVLGTLLAVVLLSLLSNVLNFVNVSTFYQWIAEGLIVIAAVSFFLGRKDT